MAQGLRVLGYREFLRACDHAGKETKREVRATFRKVGDIVKVAVQDRLGPLSPHSAAGVRTVVRLRGVSVEQTLRKTTGTRPDWGATQMRDAFEPGLRAKEAEVIVGMEHAVETVADHFEH